MGSTLMNRFTADRGNFLFFGAMAKLIDKIYVFENTHKLWTLGHDVVCIVKTRVFV